MKVLRVTMPDGSRWDVPAEKIAENRAGYYADREQRIHGMDHKVTFQRELAFTMDNHSELIDWAENNMNWSDVEEHAVRVLLPCTGVDYQSGWVNGKKKVLEK